MAWADFWLSRIGLLAAAGVLLVAALLIPSALAPRGQEAAAARAADEIAQRAAALAGALPGTAERLLLPEGVEVEVGPGQVAARAGPYREVRYLPRPLVGPTSFGAEAGLFEGAVALRCGPDSACAEEALDRARAEFREFPLRPIGRAVALERLGPAALDSVFISEPGRSVLRARPELRRDEGGATLQRVEVLHLGGPSLDVRGAEVRLSAWGEPLGTVALPATVGIAGTRGVGGVFHSNNTSGPLWEAGESGWVNVARGRRALIPGDLVRFELWSGSRLLARADGEVADRR
ncbi:MAG: hypothetical protein QXT68_09960 [Halobacteria archaeon]